MSDQNREPAPGVEALSPGELIELRLPARPESVAVVRLALSAIAEQLGLTYDDIVELKIAASEACAAIISRAGGTDGALVVRARRIPRGVAVEVTGPIASEEPAGDDDLRLALIRALVDDLEAALRRPRGLVRFSRRSTSA